MINVTKWERFNQNIMLLTYMEFNLQVKKIANIR